MCLILYPRECKWQPAVYTHTHNNPMICFLKPLCPVVAPLKYKRTALMSNTVCFNCFQPHLSVALDKSMCQMTSLDITGIFGRNVTLPATYGSQKYWQINWHVTKLIVATVCTAFPVVEYTWQNLLLVNSKCYEEALEESIGYDWMANATLTCFWRQRPSWLTR